MTEDQARTYRLAYGAVCGVTAITGAPTLVLSILKIGFEGQTSPFFDLSRIILRLLYPIQPDAFNSIWPWLSGYDYYRWLIPTLVDQNPLAQARDPMEMIFHGCSTSLFQA